MTNTRRLLIGMVIWCLVIGSLCGWIGRVVYEEYATSATQLTVPAS